ncbi:YqjK family protein [Halomonas halocynthiae]|uniref:YqjK family protein n=1 Tax=Halomonas halocynthiae TaxID=176290 RepID=UPI00040B2BAF|nr:YqjK family protein [Halomonas halocynthiae]
MSHSANQATTKRQQSKAELKAELEAHIDQQRLALMYHSARLRQSAAPIDQGLQRAWQWRIPLIATAGIALLPVLRRPGSVIRLSKKLALGALTLNRARRLLR